MTERTLQERLRAEANTHCAGVPEQFRLLHEAASALDAAEARIRELEAALDYIAGIGFKSACIPGREFSLARSAAQKALTADSARK